MKQLEKMEMIERPKEKIKPSFSFKEARTPSKFIVEAEDIVIGYGEPLTKKVSFVVERNKKIAIKGVNGIGKSTLLKTMLGLVKPLEGKISLGQHVEYGFFEQEDTKKNRTTALDEVWNLYPNLTNHEVRLELARCGLTSEHITSQMMVLSGGENAKVRLCKIILKENNFLVLDEPTNHLDVEAKEELKKAIKEFKGTVVLVSHEPEFYDNLVDEVWNIEDWSNKIL